jgi:hypothetical protein
MPPRTEHAGRGRRSCRAHVVSTLLALRALTAAEEALDRDGGGAVLQNPGELVACDLCAAPSQVFQVRGADPRRHDAYKFPYTLRLVDIDDLNRGRGVAHRLHQMSSPD